MVPHFQRYSAGDLVPSYYMYVTLMTTPGRVVYVHDSNPFFMCLPRERHLSLFTYSFMPLTRISSLSLGGILCSVLRPGARLWLEFQPPLY